MIILSNGTELNNYSAFMRNSEVRGETREVLEIHLRQEDNPEQELSYEWLKNNFSDGSSITIRETSNRIKINEDGSQSEITDYNDYPYPDHTIAGPITDKMDGTFIVSLCKKTEREELEELNATLILMLGGVGNE